MKPQKILSASLAWTSAFAYGNQTDFEANCDAVTSQLDHVANATVWFSQFVTAGTNLSLAGNNVTCGRQSQVVSVDLCRVALYVSTSERSGISLEAWLPKDWSGRFLSTGNGGVSGCIQYEDIEYASSLGFATVGANNGHNGTSGGAFLNNEDVVIDFSYRSVHTGVVVGKQITETFYGEPHQKSYYLGCSTGGRQGFQEAQMFPNDFDGIVAGSPAFDFNNLVSWSGSFYIRTGPTNSSTFIPKEKYSMIYKATLDQCDGLDGSVDGIIEDPDLCHPRFEDLVCSSSSNDTSKCLTAAQVSTANAIHSPIYDNQSTLLYPRLQPGSHLFTLPGYSEQSFLLLAGRPFAYTLDWYRNAIYNDPTWAPETLDTATMTFAAAKNPGDIDTFNGDLSPFHKAGGKILTYHGLVDSLISSDNSARYYNHVSRTMSLPSSKLDEFYRYFRIAGQGHCSQPAPGAWKIGNIKVRNEQVDLDPERNVLMAMVRWVEEGVAPETIEGTKYVNDTVALGVEFRRKHCRYPRRNVYRDGEWECV